MQFHRPAIPKRPPEPSGDQVSSFKVTKKLSSGSPGAQKLKDRFGEALVCVRHRIIPDGKNRSTTVELLVEHRPVRRRESPVVGVQIALGERELQALVCTAGASWDPSARLWKMPLRTVEALGLKDRVRKPQE